MCSIRSLAGTRDAWLMRKTLAELVLAGMFLLALYILTTVRSVGALGREWTTALYCLVPGGYLVSVIFVKPKEDRPRPWKLLAMASAVSVSTIAAFFYERSGCGHCVNYVLVFYLVAVVILRMLP